MSGRRARAAAAALACALAVACSAGAAAPAAAAVTIALDRERVATTLGGGFTFTSTITNTGRRPLTGLVAHMNIASLRQGGAYVDPEDWSPQRTQYLAPLRPGRSVKLSWRLTAVGGGRVGVYITVLPAHGARTAAAGLAVGEPIDVRVAERRTLNNDGVLFVVLGIPGALALAMVGTAARRRRT